MISRLIQNQQICRPQKHLSQSQTRLLTPTQSLHLLKHHIPSKQKPAQMSPYLLIFPIRNLIMDRLHHTLTQIQSLSLILLKIRRNHIMIPQLNRPIRRLFHPHNQMQKRRFSTTIWPQKSHPVAPFNQQLRTQKQNLIIIRMHQILNNNHLSTTPRRIRKTKFQRPHIRNWCLNTLNFI